MAYFWHVFLNTPETASIIQLLSYSWTDTQMFRCCSNPFVKHYDTKHYQIRQTKIYWIPFVGKGYSRINVLGCIHENCRHHMFLTWMRFLEFRVLSRQSIFFGKTKVLCCRATVWGFLLLCNLNISYWLYLNGYSHMFRH